jgi:hypothetical protein
MIDVIPDAFFRPLSDFYTTLHLYTVKIGCLALVEWLQTRKLKFSYYMLLIEAMIHSMVLEEN